MPEASQSKQRSVRIPLDYYKKPDGYTRWKTWLSLACLAAVPVWLLSAGHTKKLATHGTLARVHATWDEKCEECHVPFRPIDGTAWTASLVTDPRASDNKCQACHKGLADHHANIKEGDSHACAACHREHRGRGALLNEVADAQCTRCHAELGGHVKPGASLSFEPKVTAFGIDAEQHPEFRLFRNGPAKDPGRLKFNHKLHMSKGLPAQAGGESLRRLSDLTDQYKEKYKNKSGNDADGIQLECASCHRPLGDRSLASASQSTSPGGASRGGAYMARAKYESDCVACHALDYDARLPAIRHGLQPNEVYDYLLGAYSALYLKGGDAGLNDTQPKRQAIPGREAAPVVRGEAMESIRKDVATAQRKLLGGRRCGECHSYESPAGGVAELPDTWDSRPTFRIARPKVLDVWLPHARFDHSSHSAVADCQKCHARAYASAPDASSNAADVMIPAAAVCRECHTPHQPKAVTATGGAGYSCTECHGYHNGDKSMPAPPPARRDTAFETDLRQFLARASGH
jgi:hypothetical protein